MSACQAVAAVVGALKSFHVQNSHVKIKRCNRSAKLPALTEIVAPVNKQDTTPTLQALPKVAQQKQSLQILKKNQTSLIQLNTTIDSGNMVSAGKQVAASTQVISPPKSIITANGQGFAQSRNLDIGEQCFKKHDSCITGYCDSRSGRCEMRHPNSRKGEYCNDDSNCGSGLMCECSKKDKNGYCTGSKNWPVVTNPKFPPPGVGICGNKLKDGAACKFGKECRGNVCDPVSRTCRSEFTDISNGYFCKFNGQCKSGYCADGKKCAPLDTTGIPGDYCHHNEHCASGSCECAKGFGGFCRNWESWGPGPRNKSTSGLSVGICNGKEPLASLCSKNSECLSGKCADGKRCSPVNGTGRPGQYCHHNDHCSSKRCACPSGSANIFGFCEKFENFKSATMLRLNRDRTGFYCR
jgi:hypothetical protein